MATTKTVTEHSITAVRQNDDGSRVAVFDVTYDDESTDTLELVADRRTAGA